MKKESGLLHKLSEKLKKAKNCVSDTFKKIKESIKHKGAKIALSAAGLAICAGIVVCSAVGFSDKNMPELESDTQIGVETVVDDAIIESIPGFEFDENNVFGPGANSTETGKGTEQSTEVEDVKPVDDIDLIEYMTRNGEYNTIIAKANGTNSSEHETFYELDPHPYTYLKAKGYNIEAIKKGKIECYSISYTLNEKPNSVFIATQVKNDNLTDHLMVEYNLTDNQMKDYRQINGQKTIQAGLVNDAISAIRKDHIVSESCITITTKASDAIDGIMSSAFYDDLNCSRTVAIVKSVDHDSNKFVCDVIPVHNKAYLNRSGKMMNITIQSKIELEEKDGVNYLGVTSMTMTKVSSTIKKGTFNQAQDINFLTGYDYITP